MKFYLNPDVDMTKVVDSMQIDSGTVIAVLEKDGHKASLEVRGEVKVWWNEHGEPCEGECYKYPSEFPEKLKRLIADVYTSDEGHWTLDPRLYISENNWFEVFVTGPENEHVPDAYVVDVEGSTEEEIRNLLDDYIEYSELTATEIWRSGCCVYPLYYIE